MAIVGAGISIDFGSGFIAELLSLVEPEESIVAVDVTSADDVNKVFIQGGIQNPGRLEGSMNFNPLAVPPLGSAPQTVTVTYPNNSTKAASGFLVSYTPQMTDIEDRMTADFVLQLTGPVTRLPPP